MVDPTSDLGADVTEESAPRCGSCDEPIVDRPTHRVVTWIDEGRVETRHFCDNACLDDWDDER